MPEQGRESANDILASLRRRFIDETAGVNGLFFATVFDTQNQLSNLSGSEQSNELVLKSRIVHAGNSAWLESLVTTVRKYAKALLGIVIENPEICSSDDPAHWIRFWIEERLHGYLRMELDFATRVKTALDNKIAENVSRGELEQCSVMPSSLAISMKSAPVRTSRIERWFRRVVERRLDFDLSASGYNEPWVAPPWCEEEDVVGARLRKYGTCPDRLTHPQTARLIRSVEHTFADRLKYVLEVEEDEARITLAQHSPSRLQTKSTTREAGTYLANHAAQPREAKKGPTIRPRSKVELTQWTGTDRRFADKILQEFKLGTFKAKSKFDALTKASKMYVRSDGSRFKPRSLWQNIKNREAEGK